MLCFKFVNTGKPYSLVLHLYVLAKWMQYHFNDFIKLGISLGMLGMLDLLFDETHKYVLICIFVSMMHEKLIIFVVSYSWNWNWISEFSFIQLLNHGSVKFICVSVTVSVSVVCDNDPLHFRCFYNGIWILGGFN